MFSYLVFWHNSIGFALVLRVYGAVSERERLLLDTTAWIVIAGFIPVCDHSLQDLRIDALESLKSAVEHDGDQKDSSVVALLYVQFQIILAVTMLHDTQNMPFGLFLCTLISMYMH